MITINVSQLLSLQKINLSHTHQVQCRYESHFINGEIWVKLRQYRENSKTVPVCWLQFCLYIYTSMEHVYVRKRSDAHHTHRTQSNLRKD